MVSRLTRRLIRRLKYPTIKNYATLIGLCLWTGVLTLWVHRSGIKLRSDGEFADPQDSINSETVFQRTVVHRTIEKWHLSDKTGLVPVLFPTSTSKWSSYPQERLFHWNEVILNDIRCPGFDLMKSDKLLNFLIQLFMVQDKLNKYRACWLSFVENYNYFNWKLNFFNFSNYYYWQHLCCVS